MTTNDFRTERTRRRTEMALIQLMQTQPLDKVTVMQICRKATISRATFYVHFYDKYDLLEQMVARQTRTIKRLLQTRFQLANADEVVRMAKPVLKVIMADQMTMQTLLRIHLPKADLVQNLQTELANQFKQFIEQRGWSSTTLPVPLDYLAMQYSSWVLTEIQYELTNGEQAGILLFSEQAQRLLFNILNTTDNQT